jgi:hypothetical protein
MTVGHSMEQVIDLFLSWFSCTIDDEGKDDISRSHRVYVNQFSLNVLHFPNVPVVKKIYFSRYLIDQWKQRKSRG